MNKKNNGFSLIEILAVLFITSALLVPLLSTLVGNIEINARARSMRNATSIAEGTLYGFEKIDFFDLRTRLNTANSSTFYLEYSYDKCDNLNESTDRNDTYLCQEIFSTVFNNLELDNASYKVYLFNYSLTAPQFDYLSNGSSIKQEAKDLIADPLGDIYAQVDEPDDLDLIRIVVWIDYHDDPDLHVVLTGLIYND